MLYHEYEERKKETAPSEEDYYIYMGGTYTHLT